MSLAASGILIGTASLIVAVINNDGGGAIGASVLAAVGLGSLAVGMILLRSKRKGGHIAGSGRHEPRVKRR